MILSYVFQYIVVFLQPNPGPTPTRLYPRQITKLRPDPIKMWKVFLPGFFKKSFWKKFVEELDTA